MLLKNATIIDGTGNPKYISDIRIENNVITEIGVNLVDKKVIDCTGKIVTPGFFDIHTHYDAELLGNADLSPSTKAGVSHIIIGNCGVGVYPLNEKNYDIILDLLEGVEDISRSISERCKPNQFRNFKEYYRFINNRSSVTVDSFLAYSCVRSSVLGNNSQIQNYIPRMTEIDEITNIINDALANGALGVSLSKSVAHKSIKGLNSPSFFSTEAEIHLILNLLRQNNKILQLVSDLHNGENDLKYWADKAKLYNIRILLSIQMNNKTNPEDSLFVMWKNKYKKYLDVQVHSRSNSIILGNDLFYNIHNKKNIDYKMLFRMSNNFNYTPKYEDSAYYCSNGDIDTYLNNCLNDDPNCLFYYATLNYPNYSLDGVKLMLSDTNTLSGLSDAGAHQANKITYKNAEYFKIFNLHKLELGFPADINIIDPSELHISNIFVTKKDNIKLEQNIFGLHRLQDIKDNEKFNFH